MRKTILPTLTIAAIVFSFSLKPAYAQQPGVLVNHWLTPDSPLYFLETFKETLQEFFTLNPEAKAQLQIDLAKERMAEINALLEKQGDHTQALTFTENKLQTNLDKTAAILAAEKQNGKNVSELSKSLSEELNQSHNVLTDSLKNQELALENQIHQLKAQISDAKKAGNTTLVDSLTKQLSEAKAQLKLLETKNDEQKTEIDKEEEKIEDQMDIKQEVTEKITELTNEKTEYLSELQKENKAIPAGVFDKFDGLLLEAKTAFDKGNYEEAKQLLKSAEKNFNEIEKAVETLNEATEKQLELQKDLKEHKQESLNKLKETAKEDIKVITEQIKKEEEKIVEGQKQAQEQKAEADKQLQEASKGD